MWNLIKETHIPVEQKCSSISWMYMYFLWGGRISIRAKLMRKCKPVQLTHSQWHTKNDRVMQHQTDRLLPASSFSQSACKRSWYQLLSNYYYLSAEMCSKSKYPTIEDFPDLSKHNNWMSKCLTPEIYGKLRDRTTPTGFTFDDCIQTGKSGTQTATV